MSRRYVPHGQRHGGADARMGYQSARRDDGARLEITAVPSLTIRKVIGFVLFIAVLAIVINGDLFL